MERTRRLFMLDPTCTLPYGHAVPAFVQFRDYLLSRYDEVICVASHRLPSIENTEFIERRFEFLYNEHIRVVSPVQYKKDIYASPAWKQKSLDPFEGISTHEMIEFMYAHEIGPLDTLFFPGADFYGLIGILEAINQLPLHERPRLMVRFIGVFEGTSAVYNDPLAELCKRINKSVAMGTRISVGAETPKYASYLNERLNVLVCVLAYPETAGQAPLRDTTTFNVLCAGSARLDKGFDLLLEIAKVLNKSALRRDIKITTQCMPYRGSEHWDNYTSQLYAMPNVEMLEPVINSTELSKLYEACHIVLLPYAADVYHLRGSAVFQEAANVGRPAVCLAGTAFAPQIEYYGFGTVCQTVAELPQAIIAHSEKPIRTEQKQIDFARQRLFVDVDAAYNFWFRD